MPESKVEQLSRVRMMAAGDDTWDLSPNDQAALHAVLQDRDALLGALERFLSEPTVLRATESTDVSLANAADRGNAVLALVRGVKHG